ncbi:TonB-dependent siderophore receptor [Floridanema evergladense]|uniref:TonB-dependent siderophore receptor n=1 Tax=Floridaenema evergladense BLCC-F167 TaxID=3153639 RepID=A0ABV4WFA5_9CYAN
MIEKFQLSLRLVFASLLACSLVQSVMAQEVLENIDTAQTSSVRDRPATTVKEWLAQIETAQQQALIQVTKVQINRTETSVEIILQTQDGKPLQIDARQFTTQGNRLIANISNALLKLPEENEFIAENPSTNITRIAINQIDGNRIQITVVGSDRIPTNVILKTGELAYELKPLGENIEDVEIVVTRAIQRAYIVPNASTATGTDTPILETPFSVQVIPQEIIRDQQVTRIEDALTNISGVTFAGSNGGREASFSIRGFGNQFANGAPVLRDGYRIYGSFQAIPELANLQQVEVLKGPSSILYGQIEPGGVINLVSKRPLAQPFHEAELQVGSREFVRPRIDLTGPLTNNGNLLYRLNLLYQHDRSFRDFETDINRFSVFPVLSWKVSDRTDLAFNLEYIHENKPADFGITKFGNGVAPVPRDFVANNPDDTIATDYLSTGYSFEHRFSDNWKIRNGFRYISYEYDYSVVALPFIVEDENITRFYADQDGQDRSYSLFTSVVGNFTTGSIKHTVTMGVDLNRSESRIATVFDAANPSILNIFNPDYSFPKPNRSSLPPFGDTLTTANRLGIYLQDQVYLLDNLILVAGLRYDSITQKTSNIQTAFNEGGETEQSNDALTPRLGLLYRPIPQLSFFANYSQSFKPNTSTTASGSILAPEEGEGFEVGIKTELFSQRLLATLTYFDITKSNVATSDPNNPLFSIAVGEQKSRGIEFDIAGEVLPGWKIIGSYAYIDAKVSNDTDETIVGNRFFGIPRNKASLWTTYEIQQGNLKGLGFGLGFEYTDDRFGNLANSYRVGNYLIGNAAIFYRRNNYRWAVNFRNISDTYYIRALTGNEGGIEPGEPLTVIGSFSIQF